jgi:hypothetical protein
LERPLTQKHTTDPARFRRQLTAKTR